MKNVTKIILLFLGIIILLPSCSIEKRRYNKGFHISKSGGHSVSNPSNESIALEKMESFSEEIQVLAQNESASFKDQSRESDVIDFMDLTEKKILVETTYSSPGIESNSNTNQSAEKSNLSKRELKKVIKKAANDDGGPSASSAFGVILLIVGLLFLLFFSILIGVLIMVLGAILLGAGAGKKKGKAESEKETKLVDVVYLKNGSIIRGTIIEQVPNVSLKIQTVGGSVFVYKMEEVDKMTKEPAR